MSIEDIIDIAMENPLKAFSELGKHAFPIHTIETDQSGTSYIAFSMGAWFVECKFLCGDIFFSFCRDYEDLKYEFADVLDSIDISEVTNIIATANMNAPQIDPKRISTLEDFENYKRWGNE